jgi:hypothetical protein
MDQLRTIDDMPPLRALHVPSGTFRERTRVRKRRAEQPAPSASPSAPAHVYAPFSALHPGAPTPATVPSHYAMDIDPPIPGSQRLVMPIRPDRRNSVDSQGTSESASDRSSSEEPSPSSRQHPYSAYLHPGGGRSPSAVRSAPPPPGAPHLSAHDAWRAQLPRTAALPPSPPVSYGVGSTGGGWPSLHLPPIDTLQEARPWPQRDVQDEMLLRALDRRTVM